LHRHGHADQENVMRTRHLRHGVIALALLGGLCSAAQVRAQDTIGSPPAAASRSAQDQLSLSPEQERSIARSLASEQTQSLPSDFQPQTGATVPESVTLRNLPSNLASEIPQVSDFKFAKLREHVLLVDAYNRQVVRIIGAPATTGGGMPGMQR
jgi:hypothetical protein